MTRLLDTYYDTHREARLAYQRAYHKKQMRDPAKRTAQTDYNSKWNRKNRCALEDVRVYERAPDTPIIKDVVHDVTLNWK